MERNYDVPLTRVSRNHRKTARNLSQFVPKPDLKRKSRWTATSAIQRRGGLLQLCWDCGELAVECAADRI